MTSLNAKFPVLRNRLLQGYAQFVIVRAKYGKNTFS